MRKYSIAIIIVYLGRWPKWYHLFLESCSNNVDIDFLIFTDQEISHKNSINIKFRKFSLIDFNTLASTKLNLPVEFNQPYKLCDFRPAFGMIFEEYLNDYSFWGYTDVDLIFGDIRSHIKDVLLESYDVITARREYLVGHFTLFKNCNTINSLFSLSKNYVDIFKSNVYFGFDECSFLWWPLISGQSILDLPSEHMSMTHLVMQLAFQNKIRALFSPLVLEQDHSDQHLNRILMWENGKLRDHHTKEDFLYFHFHYLKKKSQFLCPDWDVIPKRFYITNNGFSV